MGTNPYHCRQRQRKHDHSRVETHEEQGIKIPTWFCLNAQMAQNKKQEPHALTPLHCHLYEESVYYFFHIVKPRLLGQSQQWLCSSRSLSSQSMRDPIICSLPILPSERAPLTPVFSDHRLFVVWLLQAVTIFLQQEMCVPYVRRVHLQEIMQESDLISLLLPSFCSVLH